ncbi:uncharacterized protein BDZ99DRAFT_481954 [Mytilinidion resinicola]|uniref:Helicase ATP-binding domain-containing protein n=1 Tax=Mytilinidion resinicola TaxID=574789 RepID=A0A6A6Y4E7_9PEZI|nr:uncharacterized protein BDZ99DRAFT_481954 [Mytilinidion resinicola]KAF2803530.1 hypothetical protein BDZ99DRAFT_481954 [Mytilinidion resinicola]
MDASWASWVTAPAGLPLFKVLAATEKNLGNDTLSTSNTTFSFQSNIRRDWDGTLCEALISCSQSQARDSSLSKPHRARKYSAMDFPTFSREESASPARGQTPSSTVSYAIKTTPSTPLSSSTSLGVASRNEDDSLHLDFTDYIALGCLHYDDFVVSPPVPTKPWSEIYPALGQQWKLKLKEDASVLLTAGWIRMFAYALESLAAGCAVFRIFLRPLESYEDRQNKILKSRLRSLVQRINISQEAWSGRHDVAQQMFDPWATGEDESLFYLFNTIPSPHPDPGVISCPYSRQAAEDLLNPGTLQGLRTKLYEFQTRSASLMVQKESAPHKILDPRFEPRYSLDNRLFYYNPNDMEFVLKPQYYDSNRGGILAETMGIGKTLICLAVILSTKDHMPSVPPRYQGGERRWGRLSRPGEKVRPEQGSSDTENSSPAKEISGINGSTTITSYGADDFWKVGTLAKMAAATATRNSIPWKRLIPKDTESSKILDAAVPSYDVPIEQARRSRSSLTNITQKVTLCSGTLIVVPPNLLTQWQSEIKKHVADGYLKVLVLDNKFTAKLPGSEKHAERDGIFCTKLLPSSAMLRTYDIVLFSRPRFEQEIKDGEDRYGRRLHTGAPTICQCPYIGATRIPDCRCFKIDETYRSPLKELHWLRMIIDEGHNFASAKSNAVLIAGQIQAERRWVVSGTPAKDLVGVDVELPVTDEYESRDAVMEKRRQFSESDDTKSAVKSLRDLAKHFLKVQPWADCDWDDYVYRHEKTSKKKTYTCFSACMKQTLGGLVIKTAPEIYEKEVSIPELTHTIIRLKPSWFDKMSANLFIQVMRANAITSERAGVDYLFDNHKNSVKARHSLLKNLRQGNFTWTGFTEENVRETLETSHKYLNKEDKKCSQQDVEILTESMQMIEQVLGSPRWLSLSKTHEMGFFVESWPQESIEYFALGGIAAPQMIGVSQLLEGQFHVNSQVSSDDPASGLVEVGEHGRLRLEQAAKAEEETAAKRKTSKSSEVAPKGVPLSCVDGEPTSASAKRSLPTRVNSSPKKGSQSTQNANAPAASNGNGEFKPAIRKRKLTFSDITKELAAGSPLLKTHVIGTTSSKLSYLLDRVMLFQAEHKIIIFYDGDNTAYYLSQCLDSLHIGHRIYARTLDSNKRDNYIHLFKEDPNIRVFLMDVACGSHGLDLHVASVVLIINPINRKDVEAQAIKHNRRRQRDPRDHPERQDCARETERGAGRESDGEAKGKATGLC